MNGSQVLSQAEQRVAVLLARGCDNKAIASELSLALPTVKMHVHLILSKLQVSNRTQAALKLSQNFEGFAR